MGPLSDPPDFGGDFSTQGLSAPPELEGFDFSMQGF